MTRFPLFIPAVAAALIATTWPLKWRYNLSRIGVRGAEPRVAPELARTIARRSKGRTRDAVRLVLVPTSPFSDKA